MKIILFFLSLITLLLSNDLDQLNLLDDLQEASEISTKTKLNINKTPSIVSVVHADELEQLGVKNLYEALATVPGIQLSMGTAGAKKINMRGNNSLTRDKIKVMINGISTNNQILGAAYIYLDMPIEQIERIEVVRGPASTLYGSQAHIGVINVITKSSQHKKNLYFVNTSSEGKTNLGFTQNITSENMKASLDGSLTYNENEREIGLYQYTGGTIDNAKSYEDFINISFGTTLEFYDDFSLELRYANYDSQNFYGYGEWPEIKGPKKLATTSVLSELRYAPAINDIFSLDLRAGYKQYKYRGFTRLRPFSQTLGFANDLIGDGYYVEHMYYVDNALKYSIKEHDLLFGVYLSESHEDSSTSYYINNPLVSEETNILNQAVEPDISRYQYALYFNDIYTISDSLVFNLGLRYDHYNDVDSNLAHKLALLYNYDESQNYKLMYQRSFRAPAWLELYGTAAPYIGNSSVKVETMDTLELAYRYQYRLDSYFNANIFYSKIKDFITSDANHNFFNDKDRNSYGVELDMKLYLFAKDSLQINYSFTDVEDSQGKDLAFIANHLANVMYIKHFSNSFNMGTKIRYIGKQNHDKNDPRSPVKAYTTFDQTITYKEGGLSIQLSVKNLLNEDVVLPSLWGNGNPLSGTGTYMDDFHRDRRTFWISAKWEFE